ncbi:MAG: orotidine-5'-phosphate decarboxylase [Planctomycetaceae bacterium]|jgi:orotidine-5'-phosphate decarboxylase|nr:orotidine-5'-phosphate decarboxylase [Planctomycetaceae bacterium]
MTFSEKLEAAVREKKSPVLVGLDPRYEMLPDELKLADPHPEPERIAAAFGKFCYGVIDTVAPLVPAVKPQMAFFEQYGSMGLFTLEHVINYAQSQGLLVILDGKRNDIGTTAEAYADGLIGPGGTSVWGADALTVSPYLGDDSLEPFCQVARNRGGGIFVLVKTSNKGGAMIQDLIAEGKPVYRHVAEYVESLNATSDTTNGYGNIGAVVGATWPRQLAELREIMPKTWFLVPGYGSQGGAAKDVAEAFDANGLGAIINNSRGINFAYKKGPFAGKFSDWRDAVRAATEEMTVRLRAETTVAKLL